MKIQTSDEGILKDYRPVDSKLEWLDALSGYWSEGRYHGGHIEYLLANVGEGVWILDGRERNTELDGVTEEDIEEGYLNADQLQAMWGLTLEEAQNSEYCRIYCCLLRRRTR